MKFTREQQVKLQEELRNRQVTNLCTESLVIVDENYYRRRGPTSARIETISGHIEDVKDFVAYRFHHDRCTPCYEHMLWSVDSVDMSEDGTHLSVRMSKSNYAGD